MRRRSSASQREDGGLFPERPRPASLRQAPRAFTLIELVVSISVGVIISGLAAGMIWNASAQRVAIAARAELTDAGSAAMEVLLRYLREIPQDECPQESTPCLHGRAQIEAASARELRYGSLGFRFDVAGGVVEMSDDGGGSWPPLVRDVTDFAFAYFDRGGTLLSSSPLSESQRQAVRRIAVDMQLGRGTESIRLRCSVYLRGFMNEVDSEVGS